MAENKDSTNENSDAINETEENKSVKDIAEVSKFNKLISKIREKTGVFHTFFMLLTAFIIILLAGIILFTVIQALDNKVKNGVYINNVDVSKLTKEEAKKKIEEKIIDNVGEDITFKYENYTYVVPLNQIKAHLDADSAVDVAYSIGRSKNIFKNDFDVIKLNYSKCNVNMGVEYDDELLNKCFEQISNKLPNQVVQPSYYIDGDKLIITSGKSGPAVDIEKAKELVIDILEKNDYTGVEYDLPVYTKEPNSIDIEAINNEITREPKDAYYTVEPRMVYAHENGISLKQSIDEIKQILNEPKEEYEIDLNITRPNVTVNDLGQEAFPDLLSTFSTRYDASNTNRTTNLRLASDKINSMVIMPGETFSYNKTVGERTIAAGYKEAAVYENGQVVDGLGGGICQISSTLYNSVLYANLEVVERTNHMFLTSYVDGGRDATVSYGSLDFRFKNNRNYPIKIVSSVQGGVATTQIYGLKQEDDYEVEISQRRVRTIPFTTQYVSKPGYRSGSLVQGGVNGSVYEAYKTLKKNGAVVSSELISTDVYSAKAKMIAR